MKRLLILALLAANLIIAAVGCRPELFGMLWIGFALGIIYAGLPMPRRPGSAL